MGALQLPLGRDEAVQGGGAAHLAGHEGEVVFFNFIIHEEFAEGAARCLPLAEEEGAAGFEVEAVHRGDGEAFPPLFQEFLAAGGEVVNLMAFTGVDRQSRRLGDDEEIAALEEDLQRRHRQEFAQPFALGEKDAGANREALFASEDVLAPADLPLPQQLAEIADRGQRDTALQQHQKGEVFFPLVHSKGEGRRRGFTHFGSRARR